MVSGAEGVSLSRGRNCEIFHECSDFSFESCRLRCFAEEAGEVIGVYVLVVVFGVESGRGWGLRVYFLEWECLSNLRVL